MAAARRSLRPLQAVSLLMLSSLVLSLLPRPIADRLPVPLGPVVAEAAQAVEPGQDGGQAGMGSLRFAAEVDADGDPATNPTRDRAVPVARVGATNTMLPVLYTALVLAVEVVPDRRTHNPAGTRVTFRLRNEASRIDMIRETTADAWGAAFVEIVLDDLHLAGTFVYTAQAEGFGTTPARSFSVDTRNVFSDTRLGAARLVTTVAADGRVVADIRSDVLIDPNGLAAQITAVRLKPASAPGAEPEYELLPSLIARRLDDYHARAELYLDAGDYMLMASVESGNVTARSEPRAVHVGAVQAPPVGEVQEIADVDEAEQTALVHYRTPSGDVALMRRSLAGLPEAVTTPAAPAVLQEQRRVGAFDWRTDIYKLTTETISDDGNKRASLDGFAYDPLLRRYDIKIESFMARPVEDQLTVEVLGPNGVVIYQETTPIMLDPDTPLRYSVSVPTDRGEPYGLRIIVHDPLGLEWLMEKVGDGLRSVFSNLARNLRRGLTLSATFKAELKVLEIKILTLTYTCLLGGGCEKKASGLLFKPGDWFDIVTTGVRDYLRKNFDVDNIDVALKKFANDGINLGNLAMTAGLGLRYTSFLFDGGQCPDPNARAQAREHVARMARALKEIAEVITVDQKKLSESLQSKRFFEFPVPGLWFLAVKLSPILAFKLDAGTSGDFALFVEMRAEVGGQGALILKGFGLLSVLEKIADLKGYIFAVRNIAEDWKAVETIVNLIASARIQTSNPKKCAPDRDDPGYPNGFPDDRRDAFENEFLPQPTGTSGQIQYIQQQIAAAQRAGLTRAETYWTLQLRQQELAALDDDTAKRIATATAIETAAATAEQRIRGLIDGTILPDPTQTITEAAQLVFIDFTDAVAGASADRERRVLLDALDFAERNYEALRGQELDLQRELLQMAQAKGVGVVDSGLVTWALAAISTIGIDADPVQIVPGVTSSKLPNSRPYSPFEAPPVLVVPSGGLYRYNGNQQVRRWLETYVESGGTLIVLAQAEGADWKLLPGGEVEGLGYNEDILCQVMSVRITNASRWIAGIDRDLPDIQVDGSFTRWPQNASVVLVRTTGNQMPAMIEYSYGRGQVVATSSYPDFYINGMQSLDDVIFARSLFGQAYLEGTGQSIAATVSPAARVTLPLEVTNTTAMTGTILTLWRDYYEVKNHDAWRWQGHQDAQLAAAQLIPLVPPLVPGESRVVQLDFPAPAVAGLFHTAYMIGYPSSWYASGGIPGPFYQVEPATLRVATGSRLTADKPEYTFGETGAFTVTIRNNQPQARTLRLVPTAGIEAAPVVVDVPAGATREHVFTARVLQAGPFRVDVREGSGSAERIASRLVVSIRLATPTLGLDVQPTQIVAGLPATATLTATATRISAGTPVAWEVRHGTTVSTPPPLPLQQQDGYTSASVQTGLPALAPGTNVTFKASLPTGLGVMTQTLTVDPPMTLQGADILLPPVIGTTTQAAVAARVLGTSYGGTTLVQALIEHNGTILARGPAVTIAIGTAVQTATLAVTLPPALDLARTYTLAISATGRAAGATESFGARFTRELPLQAPTTTLRDSVRREGQSLTARITALPDAVRLPAAGPYTVTLRGPGLNQTTMIATAAERGGGLELSVPVPNLQRGGVFTLGLASPRLAGWLASETWTITAQQFIYTAPATATAGSSFAWRVRNIGGIDSRISGTLRLRDLAGVMLLEQALDTPLAANSERSVSMALAAQLRSGGYVLQFEGTDHLGQRVVSGHFIAVQGLDVSLDTTSGKPAYLATEQVGTTSRVTTSRNLENAELRLRVLKPADGRGSFRTLAGVPQGANGTGNAASFDRPAAVALAPDGRTAYVADQDNHAIRQVDIVTGATTTFAGPAYAPGSTDGDRSTARFFRPAGIAIDTAGDFLLVADTGNHTIRRIDLTTNQVTTIAGAAGEPGFVDGPGTSARFTTPLGIDISPNGAFAIVADQGNGLLRRIDLLSAAHTVSMVTTMFSPRDVAIAADNRTAYVTASNRIQVVDLVTSFPSRFAGPDGFGSGYQDGAGLTAALFDNPAGIAIDAGGTFLLIADELNQVIRRIDIATRQVTTHAGSGDVPGFADGSGASARFRRPLGLDLNSTGVAVVADTGNDAIRRLATSRAATTVAGRPRDADGAGDAGRIFQPGAMAISTDNEFALIVDHFSGLLRRIDAETGEITTIAGGSDDPNVYDGIGRAAAFDAPRGVALNAAGTFALVTDFYAVRRVDLITGAVTTFAGARNRTGSANGPRLDASFDQPSGIALSRDGSFVLVVDQNNHTIRKIDMQTGMVTTLAGMAGQRGFVDGVRSNARFALPRGITLSDDGAFALVADTDNHAIRRVNATTGDVSTLAGDPSNGVRGLVDGIGPQARFADPYAVDLTSDGRWAFVADATNTSIRRIEMATARVTTLAGPLGGDIPDLGLGFPTGVATSADGSFVLVASTGLSRVQRIDTQTSGAAVLREEWLAVSGADQTIARELTGLTGDPRTRGQLILEATLFSREPANAARDARHMLAQDRATFAILDPGARLTLGARETPIRADVAGYSGDDAASTFDVVGLARNTSTLPASNVNVTVRRNGTVIATPSFPTLPVSATATFSVPERLTAAGVYTYTVTSSIGGSATTVVEVIAATLAATTTASPTTLALGQAITLQSLLRNTGAVPGFVSVDLGTGVQHFRLDPGAELALTRVVTPTAAGTLALPVVYTGDLQRTDTRNVTVRDESATATLALGGVTRDATTLVQGPDGSLVLTLANSHAFGFDAVIDYTITGPQPRSGSEQRTLAPGTTTFSVPLGALPTGTYNASFTIKHARTGTRIASLALSFAVVAPRYRLVLDPGAVTTGQDGAADFGVSVTNTDASDGAWSGALVLSGAIERRVPLTLARDASRRIPGTLPLLDRAGPQTVELALVDPDGQVLARATLQIDAAPRVAPAVTLVDLGASRGTVGGTVDLTVTLANTGPAGDAQLTLVTFDQSSERLAAASANGTSRVTFTVAVPDGILAGTYPVSVRLGQQDLTADVVVEGAAVRLEQRTDARDYAPFTRATWTVDLIGERGGPAQYDVFMRYGSQEQTQTVTVGAGQRVSVDWTFDLGPASDRGSVLVTNHPVDATQTRFTVVIDSQWFTVREDERAWLEADRDRYNAGDTVRLTLHLTKPTRMAMVLPPADLPGNPELLLWSSLEVTPTAPGSVDSGTIQGDFPMDLALPLTMRTGRYFVRFLFDGEERTLPIDVYGFDIVPGRLTVGGAGADGRFGPGDAISVTTLLRADQAVGSAVLTAYALSPAGDYIELGSTATITQPLAAGTTPLTLSGRLQTDEAGAHQIVVKVYDAPTGTVLASEARFIDVGGATISALSLDRGRYTPGQAGQGTIAVYGVGQVAIAVRTSGGATLLIETRTLTGFLELSFAVPTADEGDKILIGSVADSGGLTSNLQVAYKVAAALDTTAPEVAATSPAPDSVVEFTGAGQQVTISGVVTETGGLREVLVDGAPATVTGNSWSIAVPLEPGDNLFQIVALDRAGNQGLAPLYTLRAEPRYGVSLAISPAGGTAVTSVAVQAVVTSTVALTLTVLFPFADLVRAESGMASSGVLTIAQGVARWEGFVQPGAPVTISWSGQPLASPSGQAVAVVQGDGISPRVSTAVVLSYAAQHTLFLPVILR